MLRRQSIFRNFFLIASLAADIANRNDPDTVLAIAKERMRLVESGEIIFYDTTN